MKKQVIAALMLVAAAIGATTPSWAFQSQQRSTVTAGAFVGGTKLARFTLTIRDTSDPLNTTVNRASVTWSNVNAGDGWKIADRLLVINSTVTDTNGGVQIYTDNTAADASPKFVDPTPGNLINADSSAGGLVQGASGAGNTVLPLAWAIKDSPKTVEGTDPATGIGAADPNNGPTGAVANNKFQWLFVTDRYNMTNGVDFSGNGVVSASDVGDSLPWHDGDAYQSMLRGSSLHVQQDPASLESVAHGTDAYVYLQANFAQANVQTAYQTNTLRVEAYIQ